MPYDVNVVLLDETVSFNFKELCRLCKVPDDQILNMVDEGILSPRGSSPRSWQFSATSVKKVQVTVRLQEDLGVNLPGAALAIELMEELELLRGQKPG